MLNEGDKAPDVTVEDADGKSVKLFDAIKPPLVLYFYPKDDTTGCTREALDFTAMFGDFTAAGVSVIGISKDTPKKHASFIKKHGLKVGLVTDGDGSACEAYGTWIEKSLYGRKYMGIDRATFLIGNDGKLARIWRKVKVAGHAEEVLAAARALK
jgi:thioredoxin-dependent peroxiredoxin